MRNNVSPDPPENTTARNGAVGDAKQFDEWQLLLKRLHRACPAHVKRVRDVTVDGKRPFHRPKEKSGNQLYGLHAFKHGWQQAGSLGVPSAFQRAHDHCVELCTGGARLCEP